MNIWKMQGTIDLYKDIRVYSCDCRSGGEGNMSEVGTEVCPYCGHYSVLMKPELVKIPTNRSSSYISRHFISPDELKEYKRMRYGGMTLDEIVKETGVKKTTLYRALKKSSS